MSRVININSAATVNIGSFSGLTSNASTGSTYPPSNGINSSANTSNYAIFSATSTSSGYAYYLFNTISVPSNATITSVSCVARGRTSATSSGTSSFQLFAGSTAKGSQTTFTTTSTTAITLTTGNWTAQEINNGIALRIGTRRASSQRAYSTRFYGATLTVNYTFQTTAYTIASTSNTDSATTSPATQEVYAGESATVNIYTDDLSAIKVEDGGIDVTNELVYTQDTGTTAVFTGIPVTYDSVNSSYDSIYTGTTASPLSDCNGTNRICVYANTGANAESYLYYNFDCSSIPNNAIISSVVCSAKTSTFCASTCFEIYQAELCSGTNAKGTPKTISGNGSTGLINFIDGGSNWTRSELNNLKIRLKIKRGTQNTSSQASFNLWGATLQINYSIPAGDYYTYTLTGVDADHTIIVSEYGFVPPEEDTAKTYYSVTISSINATTSPGRGTTRVESGTSETITIYPDDPVVTLILDNGVDVSSQLVSHSAGSPSSSITNTTTQYGFVYCASTGYYTSNNKGVASSAAVARVTLNLPVRCLITVEFINYAEATYDYGIFGNVDVALTTNSGSDTNAKLVCNTSTYNVSTPQTLTYEIEAGSHFIDFKYRKDTYTDSNNDNLQFKIASIQELEANNYYTYTLSNISSAHSLIFVFGNVSYYFVNSNKNGNCKIYPDGQYVILPGDDYRITVVPNVSSTTVAVTDNGVDVTSSLDYKEIETVKGGVTSITVNYIYTITNVQTGHTILVSTLETAPAYIKQNNSWVQLRAVYKKINNAWVEQDDMSTLFSPGDVVVPGENGQ